MRKPEADVAVDVDEVEEWEDLPDIEDGNDDDRGVAEPVAAGSGAFEGVLGEHKTKGDDGDSECGQDHLAAVYARFRALLPAASSAAPSAEHMRHVAYGLQKPPVLLSVTETWFPRKGRGGRGT